LRVLAVSHSYPRFDGDVAGAFLERLYEAMQARGFRGEVRLLDEFLLRVPDYWAIAGFAAATAAALLAGR